MGTTAAALLGAKQIKLWDLNSHGSVGMHKNIHIHLTVYVLESAP